ncbi:MAG: adenylate/guanylate cyclase domain-containing protein [Actinobacteria bacterium]|nr:MAG: adenylate/guanylate cyclase domain-containing protein [Actinomycetota bacterium]
MRELPIGIVTLLFTDIEGSTRLLQQLGRERYVSALSVHRRLLREAFARHGGVEVDTQGDSFLFAFGSARASVAAAVEGQRALALYRWPDEPVRVRIGLHTGEPVAADGLYAGLDVHRAARVMSAGHGGQVLLSQTTRDLVGSEVEVRDLGEHRLKDLAEPEWLFQLGSQEFPPLKTISNTNLPVPANRFVGREEELVALRALLLAVDHRLITLTGAGGSGKSRLAVATALELVEEFPNGVFFVELAPIAEPKHVAAAIAQVLGVRETPARPLIEGLKDHLADKRTLLVVDNFEHLLKAAPIVSELVHAAPRLVVLATSRERLRLSHEHEYPVPPLPEMDALALFVERAQATEGLEATEKNRAVLVEICRRLDGLPLALELAAARLKLLPPAELLARLEQRLPLLTGGARDVPERQRTLRATIEWSHELLEPQEQRLFARLGVFAGGCGLGAAEEVCGADLDALQSLLEKSLLRQARGPDGGPRFWMLETIREYALDRLAAAREVEAARHRHAEHYATRSEQAEDAIKKYGVSDQEYFERIGHEQANIAVALRWALDAGEAALALRLVYGAFRLWFRRGQFREGGRASEEALALSGGPPELRAQVLTRVSDFPKFQGDLVRAAEMKEEAIAFFREYDDELDLASALKDLAEIVGVQGDTARAHQLAEEALALRRAVGVPSGIAHALSGLAELERMQKNFGRAIELHNEVLNLLDEPEGGERTLPPLHSLGDAWIHCGHLDRARDYLVKAVSLSGEVEDMYCLGACFESLARLAERRGRFRSATRLLGAGARIRESTGAAPDDPQELERLQTALCAQLGDNVYEACLREGAAMTMDEASQLAGAASAAASSETVGNVG